MRAFNSSPSLRPFGEAHNPAPPRAVTSAYPSPPVAWLQVPSGWSTQCHFLSWAQKFVVTMLRLLEALASLGLLPAPAYTAEMIRPLVSLFLLFSFRRNSERSAVLHVFSPTSSIICQSFWLLISLLDHKLFMLLLLLYYCVSFKIHTFSFCILFTGFLLSLQDTLRASFWTCIYGINLPGCTFFNGTQNTYH